MIITIVIIVNDVSGIMAFYVLPKREFFRHGGLEIAPAYRSGRSGAKEKAGVSKDLTT